MPMKPTTFIFSVILQMTVSELAQLKENGMAKMKELYNKCLGTWFVK